MNIDQESLRDDGTRTMTAARQMLPAGTVLAGRYRIIEVLGTGGMGVVYRAHDQSLTTEVALKTLADRVSSDPDALERFRREIRLARQVSHPNVVRIHDIGADGDLVFMTMDLVPGRTLVEHLAGGPLDPAGAVAIAMQLAAALAEAHRHGIVHRDVKPSNVLVDDDGNAWLTDFGIARAIDQQGPTRAGQTIGTLAYMAPEQIRGDADVDGRADLYALGLVLWEMLTGEVPLKGETTDETIARRLNRADPGPLPGGRRIPRALRQIVQRCLEPDPDKRPPDAGSLHDRLARGRAGINWKTGLRRAAGIALVGLAAVLAAPHVAEFMRGNEPAAGSAPNVAVLPVVNSTGDPDFDWIRNGLAETTAVRLAEHRGLNLIDPARVRTTLADLRFDVEDLGPDRMSQLAELLGADWIIRQSLLGSRDQLRLQVRIVGASGAAASAFQLDSTPDALLARSDRAATRIAESLNVSQPMPAPPAPPPMSADREALAAFDAGVDAMARGNHQAAIEHLDTAVSRDPDFGHAWARLADARAEAGFYDEALNAAERAAALLDGQGGRAEAWANARLAALAGRTERAVERFTGLVEQYPNDTDARLALAELLAESGALEEAAQAAREVTGIDPSHPRAWFLLGKFAVMSGDVQRAAEDYFVKALVIQNRLGNPEGRAEVLNGLGIAHERLGELDASADYYREAAALREQAGARRGHAASLSNLGRVHLIRGRYEPAREALDHALSVRREMGDLHGLARTYYEIGGLEEEVGHYPEARDHYRDALRIHEQLGNTLATGGIRIGLAFIHLMLGEYDTAEAFAQRALDQQTEAGDVQGQMSALQILGELAIARGRWDEAQTHLLRALGFARDIGNPFGEASVHGSIGLLAGLQGRIAAALDAFDEAVALLEPLNDRRGLAEYHLRAAETLEGTGLLEKTGDRWAIARDFFGEQANLSQRARLARIEAVLAAADERADAAAIFDEALQLARASASEAVAVNIRISRLRWLDGSLADFEQLADSAGRLGHRPLQLEALALLARKQLETGAREKAGETISRTLRPPLALEPWLRNWELHSLRERILSTEPEQQQSRRLLADLAGQMPPDLQPAFRQLHDL